MSIFKVKIVTFGNFPYGRASANYLRNLALVLADFSEVEVLLPTGYSYGKIKNTNHKRVNSYQDVSFRYLGNINRPESISGKIIDDFFGRLNLYYYLIKIGMRKEADLVIRYNIKLFSNIIIMLICRIFKIKLINILPEFYPRPQKKGLQILNWYLFYFGITYISKFSDGIITLSNYLFEYVRKNKFKGPMVLIPNIVDPDFFSNGSCSFKKGHITIGYTGTPTQKDGIDDLLKSFEMVKREHNNIHLLVIGDTASHSSIPKLKDKANALGIEDNVTFTGLVSFMEIPKRLNACDILVLTRPKGIQAEAGFPTKLGEYMACKKPVVLTAVGDMNDYFAGKDIVQLVEPGNIDSIARGLSELIADCEKRELIGSKGHEWMINNLAVRGVSKKVYGFINNIL